MKYGQPCNRLFRHHVGWLGWVCVPADSYSDSKLTKIIGLWLMANG